MSLYFPTTGFRTILIVLSLCCYWNLPVLPAQAFHLHIDPPAHTPVLIVPGLTGTEIYKDVDLLWPDILKMVNPFNSDSFMDPLAFKDDLTPMDLSLTIGQVVGNPSGLF